MLHTPDQNPTSTEQSPTPLEVIVQLQENPTAKPLLDLFMTEPGERTYSVYRGRGHWVGHIDPQDNRPGIQRVDYGTFAIGRNISALSGPAHIWLAQTSSFSSSPREAFTMTVHWGDITEGSYTPIIEVESSKSLLDGIMQHGRLRLNMSLEMPFRGNDKDFQCLIAFLNRIRHSFGNSGESQS